MKIIAVQALIIFVVEDRLKLFDLFYIRVVVYMIFFTHEEVIHIFVRAVSLNDSCLVLRQISKMPHKLLFLF